MIYNNNAISYKPHFDLSQAIEIARSVFYELGYDEARAALWNYTLCYFDKGTPSFESNFKKCKDFIDQMKSHYGDMEPNPNSFSLRLSDWDRLQNRISDVIGRIKPGMEGFYPRFEALYLFTLRHTTAYGYEYPVTYVKGVFTGGKVKFEGWEVLATLHHVNKTDAAVTNILGSTKTFNSIFEKTGATFETFFKLFQACSCTHCGVSRLRKTTFVMYNEEKGELAQVGSTCVEDFVGLPGASDILRQLSTFNFSDPEFRSVQSYNDYIDLIPALARAIQLLDLEGFYPKGSQAGRFSFADTTRRLIDGYCGDGLEVKLFKTRPLNEALEYIFNIELTEKDEAYRVKHRFCSNDINKFKEFFSGVKRTAESDPLEDWVSDFYSYKTCNEALYFVVDPTEEQFQEAIDAVEWAKTLHTSENDFDRKLSTIAGLETIDPKTLNTAVWITTKYRQFLAESTKEDETVEASKPYTTPIPENTKFGMTKAVLPAFEAVCTFVGSYSNDFGEQGIYKFEVELDDAKMVFTYFGSSSKMHDVEEGERYLLSGKVVKIDEFNGIPFHKISYPSVQTV